MDTPAAGARRRPRCVAAQEFVTEITHPHPAPTPALDAGARRERARLWRSQTAFSAAQAAGTIGMVWWTASRGGGPLTAAAIIAASVFPVAVGAAPAAYLVARASRRVLLWSSQFIATLALGFALLFGVALGDAAAVGAIAVVGAARAVFDAAVADVLAQLVARERTHQAMRELTGRFGLGQVIGVAGLLVTGLIGGPTAALMWAMAAAAAGTIMAFRHEPPIDLRPPGAQPLHRGLRTGAPLVWRNGHLRAAVAAGAVSVAIGAALSACLILWLRDGVGLRDALVPTLIAGLLLVRLARPLLLRVARRASPRALVLTALAIQGAAALTAHHAGGAAAGALAYALSLASGAFLAALITRAHAAAAPPAVAPAVAHACGAAWALAAAVGATAGAFLAVTLGMADAYLALAGLALAAAAASAAPAAIRRRRRTA